MSFTGKKPKAKKETASDSSDGVLNLLGRLTLQSSSTQTQTLLPSTSNAEVILLDTPRRHEQLQGGGEPPASPSRPPSGAESEAAASPSVSAVIDALHLSDIDWNALSFTSSPTSQAAEPKTTEEETRIKEQDVQRVDSRSAVELHYTERPLRDRVLKNQTKKCNDTVSKHLNYEPSLPGNKNQTRGLKEQQVLLLETHSRINYESSSPEKPRSYRFVRTALSSSAPLQSCSSVPESKTVSVPPQISKKSVCSGACLSSEDSDAENRPCGPRRQTKTDKKIQSVVLADFPPKPISRHFQTIQADQTHEGSVVPAQNRRQDVGRSNARDEVRLQTPASPVASFDADDAVVCSDSPLPLAERLRLKFLK